MLLDTIKTNVVDTIPTEVAKIVRSVLIHLVYIFLNDNLIDVNKEMNLNFLLSFSNLISSFSLILSSAITSPSFNLIILSAYKDASSSL